MKVVNLSLPENGLVLVDCERRQIVGKVEETETRSGKRKLPDRVLFTRFGKSSWKPITLRKDEFVCSLKSLNEMVSDVLCNEANDAWF